MTSSRLRVQKSSEAPRHVSSETQFENKITKILHKLDIFSYHVSEKRYMGIPDRYVQGGRWIEFKQCAVVKTVTPGRYLSRSQERFINDFYEAGDKPYVCVLFQFRLKPPKAILEPWETFRVEGYQRWDVDKINERAYLEEDWEAMVRAALT